MNSFPRPFPTSFNSLRRRLLKTGLAVPLLHPFAGTFAAAVQANGIGMLEAINQAGRQRMLSQRVAKLYAQSLREIRQAEARKLTGESISLFEKQLATLRGFAQQKNAPDIVATYDQLSLRWQDYKAIVGAPPNGEGLRQVVTLNEQVLATAHQGTLQLEKLHGGSLGKLVNICGRQRMLSQRMSKFYFFSRNGLSSPDIVKGLGAARTEFLAAMTTLRQAPENTADINAWIALAEGQWPFFDAAVNARAADKQEIGYHDNNVAITSENILQVMNSLTNLYAGLS